MIGHVHLILTGTSLLRNYSLEAPQEIRDKYRSRGFDQWHVMPPSDSRQRYLDAIREGHELYELMLKFIDSSPKKSCAELNAFYTFLDERRAWKNLSEVYLYATDTSSCMLCARLIYEHLRRAFGPRVQVQEPIRVKGWGVEEFEKGLIRLLDLLAGIIKSKKDQGFRVFVNATAGFKPEAAFATLASALLKADGVYYIHEASRQIVYIPLLPLTIEKSYLKALRRLGKWMPKSAAEELLRYHGLSLTDLEDMGFLDEKNGKVIVKRWVRKLLAKAD